MPDAEIVAYVEGMIADWPDVSEQQSDRIAALLRAALRSKAIRDLAKTEGPGRQPGPSATFSSNHSDSEANPRSKRRPGVT